MKKLITCALALVLALSLAACGGKKVSIDTAALAAELSDADLFLDSLVSMDEAAIGGQCESDVSGCVSMEYHAGMGATAEEWGVFECADAKAAKALAESLGAHRDSLLETYTSYAPDAVPRIENAVIRQSGQYVLIVIAADYEGAAEIADRYFS